MGGGNDSLVFYDYDGCVAPGIDQDKLPMSISNLPCISGDEVGDKRNNRELDARVLPTRINKRKEETSRLHIKL